jgi:hypothetical protein
VSDILTTVGMKVGSVTCASIAVHVQLVCHVHRYFTCTLTIDTLQALYQNHIISYLHTSSILHDIPKLFFPAGLWYYTCCGNFSDCPFVGNHLLKVSYRYPQSVRFCVLECNKLLMFQRSTASHKTWFSTVSCYHTIIHTSCCNHPL